jgi:hypothetical protein
MLVVLGALAPARLASQTQTAAPAPKKTAPAADIFSGTVTKLANESITVVRQIPGHPAVTRAFIRDEHTKVEGKLRERVRVTVRYKASESDGFVAVYIVVR